MSKSLLNPIPVQSGHIPKGLLKEKDLGSMVSILVPQFGQDRLALKLIGSPPTTST